MTQLYNAIKIEAMLGIKSAFRYKVGIISDFIIFFTIYILAVFFGSVEGFLSSYVVNVSGVEGRILILIGVIFWQLSITALGFSSNIIRNSYATGTLELRLQSKVSPIFLIFIDVMINLLTSLAILGIVLVISYFYLDLFWNDVLKVLSSILVVIPSVIGMFGIGLFLGGLTLKEKNIGQFIMIFQGILLFVSNSIIPISNKIINILPFPLGIDITRLMYLNQHVPLNYISSYLLINSGWFILGIIIFNIMLRAERVRGSFDTY